MRKPNIPEQLRRALEESGAETIRMALFDPYTNRDGLPVELLDIVKPESSERQNAIAWLKWKDANRNCQADVVLAAAVIAAIAAVIGVILALVK
jgi:hypothetical protein